MRHPLFGITVLSFGALALASGCSLKTIALTKVADAMTGSGNVYARDDDPELVRDAVPVILKTMEQLHDALPKHRALAAGLTRTATAYGAVFLTEDADRMQERDVAKARPMYLRARRMFLRARGYGLDGLDEAAPGLRAALEKGTPDARKQLLAKVKKEDVGLLYWTGAAWGSAISVSKNDMKLVGQLPQVEELMKRALELDESFEEGSIHEFFVLDEAGKDLESAKKHFARARVLSGNKKLGLLVSYAETLCVQTQDRKTFDKLLKEVTDFDVDSDLDHRLVNTLAQRRAHWLSERASDLFAE